MLLRNNTPVPFMAKYLSKPSMASYNAKSYASLSAEPHARLPGNKIIYPNSMYSRENLSKMSKDELINMLMGEQTVGIKKTGPVKQTASTSVRPVFKPKSLVQLAAKKLEQSIKRPAVQPKQSSIMPTLKTLAANAMVKDKIKYFEKLSEQQAPTIRLDKKPVSLQDKRDEELVTQRVSRYKKDSSFQNLLKNRLDNVPGKRERAQITINTVIGHTIGNRTEFTDKTYGPFNVNIPKLSKPDMYKFLMYTLLKNNFTVLSTEIIAEIGAAITTYNEQFFKDHKVGALKLNTFSWISSSRSNNGVKIPV